MNQRENTLRASRFEKPEYIPIAFYINTACWYHYDQDVLQDLMEEHHFLFPEFTRQKTMQPALQLTQRKDSPYTDPWGCVWETAEDGITGTVTRHPLEDWSAFDSYIPPNPNFSNGLLSINWPQVEGEMRAAAEQQGHKLVAGLRHGHTFLQLCDLRGYENLMYDMCDGEPRLLKLIEMVEAFNLEIVNKYLSFGVVDWMSYPEDLGMQVGPMLCPEHFRNNIKPSYQRLIRPAREAGCIIYMHSDGDIRQLAEDLIDVGVQVLNLQDIVNGIDWIKKNLKGKVAIDLDIDRQKITRFGSPAEIDEHIKESVRKLGSPDGGLMLKYGLYPGLPLENVKAVMDAMEKYAGYYQ